MATTTGEWEIVVGNLHAKQEVRWVELDHRAELSNLPQLINQLWRNFEEKFTHKLEKRMSEVVYTKDINNL